MKIICIVNIKYNSVFLFDKRVITLIFWCIAMDSGFYGVTCSNGCMLQSNGCRAIFMIIVFLISEVGVTELNFFAHIMLFSFCVYSFFSSLKLILIRFIFFQGRRGSMILASLYFVLFFMGSYND